MPQLSLPKQRKQRSTSSFNKPITPRGCDFGCGLVLMKRKIVLENGCIHHVFNRSIAGFKIFNSEKEFRRMQELALYYQYGKLQCRFSYNTRLSDSFQKEVQSEKTLKSSQKKIVKLIAYCLMPTHYHFILKQNEDKGIERFIGNLQNSYSKYFNIKHKRKGPLWEGRFKNVLVETDEQLIHLTRYLHLNPTSSSLVDDPLKWQFSSYKEFISPSSQSQSCDFSEELTITPESYKEFVNSNKDYQRELNRIKHLTLE